MKIVHNVEAVQIVSLIKKMRELRAQVSQERETPACFTEIAFATLPQLFYWMPSDVYFELAQILDAERFAAIKEWRREQDKAAGMA